MNNLQHCINLFCSKRSKSTFPAIEGGKLLKYPRKIINFHDTGVFDLGFVTIESGVLNSIEKPDNRPLTESQVYQQRLKKIKTEEFLLYSDCQTIQQWLWNEEDK